MKKSLFLTFITACFPGFGQMYYGYMRRGTSLALWFWGLVFFASLSGLGMLGILLPVIWAYSFFDTFNIRSLSPEQYAAFGDDFLPSRAWAEQMHLDKLTGTVTRRKVVGWVLIIFGLLIIYNTLFAGLIWRLYDYAPILAHFIEAIPPLFIAGVVILLGLGVLRGKSFGFKRENDDDDFRNWQSGGATPPPQAPTGTPGWDVRQNPAPQPNWNFSQPTAPSPAPQPAAPVSPVAPAAPAAGAPVAPPPQPAAPVAPPVFETPEIVLNLDTPILPDEPSEPQPAAEASSAPEEPAGEPAPAAETESGAPAEDDAKEPSKAASGKKGKKKESGDTKSED